MERSLHLNKNRWVIFNGIEGVYVMVKKDLIKRATVLLRENKIRKLVSMPKHVFRISDDDGGQKDFVVRKSSKSVAFTMEDVEHIFDACLYAIQEALRAGDSVSMKGFGTFGLNYRKPSMVKNVLDGQEVQIGGHYVPKFTCGNDLRRCAQVYEQTLIDRKINEPLPVFNKDD